MKRVRMVAPLICFIVGTLAIFAIWSRGVVGDEIKKFEIHEIKSGGMRI